MKIISMDFVGSFEIDGLRYGLIQISENYFQVSVPSLGSQRSAFHVAPRVFVTMDGDSVVITGDKSFDNETEQAIKRGIMTILKEKSNK